MAPEWAARVDLVARAGPAGLAAPRQDGEGVAAFRVGRRVREAFPADPEGSPVAPEASREARAAFRVGPEVSPEGL